MQNILLSAKEKDAIETMIAFWLDSGQVFRTKKHGYIMLDELQELKDKVIR